MNFIPHQNMQTIEVKITESARKETESQQKTTNDSDHTNWQENVLDESNDEPLKPVRWTSFAGLDA